MFNWFKRLRAPMKGPDYRHIDTLFKAQVLCRQGELRKLLLLPAEFGGQDIAVNVVYVPPFAAELKTRLDLNTIMPLAREGRVSRYTATPEYEGKSVVPSLLHIVASDPQRFEGSVAIWGLAVQNAPLPAPVEPIPDPPPFMPADQAVDALDPAEFVRAFIADYDAWNAYAYQADQDGHGNAMALAESAYRTLLRKFCRPGHVHEPLAFGSKSSHDPSHETVVGVEPGTGASRVVKTRVTRTLGAAVMEDDYEYHLQAVDGRWFLTSVLYVDKDGKYEGL